MARALPKEVMWRIIQFVDDSSQLRATSSRWKHVGRGNSSMETVLRAKGSIPNELLVGLVLQFLDEPDAGDRLRHIAKVWAAYLQRVAATAATVTATAGGSGEEGMVPFPPLGMSFGPATEPGPLDTTGRLPSELLESMFDYLEEDMTVNCASVARRWRASAMELILTSFLSPILWVIPQGAVQNMMTNLHPTDLTQVACVCQDWRQLAQDVPALAPGVVD
ncbi:unnamed protein product [Ectocarpus sp. 8 AP-2014]